MSAVCFSTGEKTDSAFASLEGLDLHVDNPEEHEPSRSLARLHIQGWERSLATGSRSRSGRRTLSVVGVALAHQRPTLPAQGVMRRAYAGVTAGGLAIRM
jgi:hypothetical protein